jgi:hypothetical protein
MNWIDLAKDWERRRAFVYVIMKQHIPQIRVIF